MWKPISHSSIEPFFCCSTRASSRSEDARAARTRKSLFQKERESFLDNSRTFRWIPFFLAQKLFLISIVWILVIWFTVVGLTRVSLNFGWTKCVVVLLLMASMRHHSSSSKEILHLVSRCWTKCLDLGITTLLGQWEGRRINFSRKYLPLRPRVHTFITSTASDTETPWWNWCQIWLKSTQSTRSKLKLSSWKATKSKTKRSGKTHTWVTLTEWALQSVIAAQSFRRASTRQFSTSDLRVWILCPAILAPLTA